MSYLANNEIVQTNHRGNGALYSSTPAGSTRVIAGYPVTLSIHNGTLLPAYANNTDKTVQFSGLLTATTFEQVDTLNRSHTVLLLTTSESTVLE